MNQSLANDIAILEECILKIKPEYDQLSDKERYLLAHSKDFEDSIRKLLVPKLFEFKQRRYKRKGFKGHDLPGYDYKPEFNPDQQYRFNAVMLWLYGLGQCKFFMNESFHKDTTLLNYNTLHDYEYDDYLFQKKSRLGEIAEYLKSHELSEEDLAPYYGIGFPRWTRLYLDGEFFYATLYSAFLYCFDAIEETASETIEKLIPYRFVEGPEHGKKTDDNCTRWDMVIEANGKEEALEALKNHKYFYLYNYKLPLLKAYFDQQPDQAFILDKGYENCGFYDKNDPHVNIVFSNKSSLKRIRFEYFLEDTQALMANADAFRQFIASEQDMIKEFIINEFNKLKI